jgi:uncharacterized protein (TIGR03083 family)
VRWAREGYTSFVRAVHRLSDQEYRAPCRLPGWTRAHLIAHVAANADALNNLVGWARTGVATPMYSSPDERAAGIAKGQSTPTHELRDWLTGSQAELDDRMAELTEAQWRATVTTAQGRDVSASEIPWLRAREVCVHSTDLDAGFSFEELGHDFLVALADDVVAKRSTGPGPALELAATEANLGWTVPGDGPEHAVLGTTAELVAYLTGRPSTARTSMGAPPPPLGPWL